MTQKKPACLPVTWRNAGDDVERERTTSASLFVCSLTFIVLFAPSQLTGSLCCLVCWRVNSENRNCNDIVHHQFFFFPNSR